MRKLAGILTTAVTAFVLLVVGGLPASATACEPAAGSFAGGTGLGPNSPWRITTIAEFQRMLGHGDASQGKYYLLENDLDFAGCELSGASNVFKGSFSGGSHTISNIVRSGSSYQGVFSRTEGATIENLRLDGIQITGASYTGALVGLADGQTGFNNIRVINADITGGTYVGGVAGAIFNGTNPISHITVINSEVRGTGAVGGLFGGFERPSMHTVGFWGGKISSTGPNQTYYFGGLIGVQLSGQTLALGRAGFRGQMDTSGGRADGLGFLVGASERNVTISDSYARGTFRLHQGDVAAGLLGHLRQPNAQTVNSITRGYFEGTFLLGATGTTQVAANPISTAPTTASSAFYSTDSHTNWVGTPVGEGKTNQELSSLATFNGFDIETNTSLIQSDSSSARWYLGSLGSGFPFLVHEFSGRTMVPCPVGRYSVNGVTSADGGCVDAPAGSYIWETGQWESIPCPAGTFQSNQGATSCLPAELGYFVATSGQANQTLCAAGTTTLATGQTECLAIASAVYSGPLITSTGISAQAGSTVNLLGSELSSVTGVNVDGLAAEIVSKSSTSITIRVPAVTSGLKDLVVLSGSGTLTVQGALRVVAGEEMTTQLTTTSIKRIGNSVRLFVSEPAGLGKIQFKINGKEIAWVRAVDAADPKLRQANGRNYFVRNAALAKGKNAVEIYVDGKRVKRVSHTR